MKCVLLWLTACNPQALSMLYHTARFPLKVEIMYYYMRILYFLIHSPINRELCCFHIWDMACNTIMNMGLVPWFLFNYPILVILRSEIARPYYSLFVSSFCSSFPLPFPPIPCPSSSCLSSLHHFHSCPQSPGFQPTAFDSHHDRYKRVLHCCFHLWFIDD